MHNSSDLAFVVFSLLLHLKLTLEKITVMLPSTETHYS